MSTDRELLELAAKAAGIFPTCFWSQDFTRFFYQKASEPGSSEIVNVPWNPLTDDSDALRLAANLDMILEMNDMSCGALCARGEWHYESVVANLGKLPATRRAIVRAAAEIGKAMP